MEKILRVDGMPFRVKYEQGVLSCCAPLCPTCESELARQVTGSGEARYVCTAGRGCENPVKRFACMAEMTEYEAAVCAELNKYLQREVGAEVTYRLPSVRRT